MRQHNLGNHLRVTESKNNLESKVMKLYNELSKSLANFISLTSTQMYQYVLKKLFIFHFFVKFHYCGTCQTCFPVLGTIQPYPGNLWFKIPLEEYHELPVSILHTIKSASKKRFSKKNVLPFWIICEEYYQAQWGIFCILRGYQGLLLLFSDKQNYYSVTPKVENIYYWS